MKKYSSASDKWFNKKNFVTLYMSTHCTYFRAYKAKSPFHHFCHDYLITMPDGNYSGCLRLSKEIHRSVIFGKNITFFVKSGFIFTTNFVMKKVASIHTTLEWPKGFELFLHYICENWFH